MWYTHLMLTFLVCSRRPFFCLLCLVMFGGVGVAVYNCRNSLLSFKGKNTVFIYRPLHTPLFSFWKLSALNSYLVRYYSENSCINLVWLPPFPENKTRTRHSRHWLTSSFADDILRYFPVPQGQDMLKINLQKTAGSRFNIVIAQSSVCLFWMHTYSAFQARFISVLHYMPILSMSSMWIH